MLSRKPPQGKRASLKSRIRLPQNIAHTTDGVDKASIALTFRLLTQVADIDLESIAGGREIVTPYLFQDLAAGENLAGIFHQQLQQRKLGAGQGNGAATAAYFAGIGVKLKVLCLLYTSDAADE